MAVLVTYDRLSTDGSLAAVPIRKVMTAGQVVAYVQANVCSNALVRITIEPLTTVSKAA